MIAMRRNDREDDDEEATPQVISDIISLVAKPVIPPAVIATWTRAEREQAVAWAGGNHLAASGNTGVKRVPQPPFVTRALSVLESRVTAQIALESWIACKDMVREPGLLDDPAESAIAGAQMAITGLLVLLGEQSAGRVNGWGSWQQAALAHLAAHLEGTRTVDLVAALGSGCPPVGELREWLEAQEKAGAVTEVIRGSWRLKR